MFVHRRSLDSGILDKDHNRGCPNAIIIFLLFWTPVLSISKELLRIAKICFLLAEHKIEEMKSPEKIKFGKSSCALTLKNRCDVRIRGQYVIIR